MSKRKLRTKDYIMSAVLLFIFITTAILLFMGTYHYIPPVTTDEVWNVLVEKGYEPVDITDHFRGQNVSLNKCIAIQKDDIRFEFYDFADERDASNLVALAYSEIIGKYNTYPREEGEWFSANNYRYSLVASGVYSVTMRVSATGIYAYCNEENRAKIDSIIRDIGYV